MAQNLVVDGTVFNGVDSISMTNENGEKVTYIEKVNTGTGVYVAQIGEQKFYTVEDALAAAAPGDTIMLISDCVENASLMVPSGVTIDLNGHTLESNFFVSSLGSQILNSKVTGVLKVPYGNAAIHKSNTYVPVWNEVDGYYLIEWGYYTGYKADENNYTYYFLPKPRNAGVVNTEVVKLLQNGAEDNQLKIEVRLVFTNDNGTLYQTQVYKTENISTVYSNNSALNNSKEMFTFVVTNYKNFTNATINAAVVSDLGSEDVSSSKALT